MAISFLFPLLSFNYKKLYAVGHTVGAVAGALLQPDDIATGGTNAVADVMWLLFAQQQSLQQQNLLRIARIAPGEHTGDIAVVILYRLLDGCRDELPAN